jgi:hypothetical protein
MDTDILSEKQAAKELFAKPATLRKWRVRGKGPQYLKLSGRIRYRKQDIEAFKLACLVDPTAKKRRKAAR